MPTDAVEAAVGDRAAPEGHGLGGTGVMVKGTEAEVGGRRAGRGWHHCRQEEGEAVGHVSVWSAGQGWCVSWRAPVF